MFKTRLLSGIVLMAITIALMVYGGYPLFFVITLISVIGLYELYRAVGMEKTMPALIGYISSIVTDVLILNNGFEELVMWLILTLMVLMACYVIAYPKYNSEQMTMLMFGLIYVTVMLSFVFKVRYVPNGILLVWFIYIGSWGSDTCAYCVGKLIGKHKMPSKLSPNKTIEGLCRWYSRCGTYRIYLCNGILGQRADALAVADNRCCLCSYLTDR